MVVAIFRSVGAVIAGLIVALILVVAVKGIYPFPLSVDPNDYQGLEWHVANIRRWLLGAMVAWWGMTALVSSCVATQLGPGRHAAHGGVVGFLLFLPMIANMIVLPYPLWFEVANLVTIPVATIFGTMLGRGTIFGRRQPSDALA